MLHSSKGVSNLPRIFKPKKYFHIWGKTKEEKLVAIIQILK